MYHQYAKTAGGYAPSGPGGYAYSGVDDVLNWTWAVPDEGSVYGFNVSLEGGQTLPLQGRERPKLLLDAAGRPAVLYNGVKFDGHSHTFAVCAAREVVHATVLVYALPMINRRRCSLC